MAVVKFVVFRILRGGVRGVRQACKASRVQKRVLAKMPVTIGVAKEDPLMRGQSLLLGSFLTTLAIQKVSMFSPKAPKL